MDDKFTENDLLFVDMTNLHAERMKEESKKLANNVKNQSVKGEQSKNVPVKDSNPRKEKKQMNPLGKILVILAITASVLGIAYVGAEAVEPILARNEIVSEVKEKYSIDSSLPEDQEEREATYAGIAGDYNLDLSDKQDQAFLFWTVLNSSNPENKLNNFTQVLNDYGYVEGIDPRTGQNTKRASDQMCMQCGYIDSVTNAPSLDVFNNYQEARAIVIAKDQEKSVQQEGMQR